MASSILDDKRLQEIWSGFLIEGEFIGLKHYEKGHINDTYIARYNHSNVAQNYVHQKVNQKVFKNPKEVMQNIRKVTDFIREKMAEENMFDLNRRVLTLVKAKDGKDYVEDNNGEVWRTYRYIDNSMSYDVVDSFERAYEVARAYGEFQRLLNDFNIKSLHETIVDFHNTPMRFKNLERAIKDDSCGRVNKVRQEIDFLMDRMDGAEKLVELRNSGGIYLRVVHYDTKCNNVLFDVLSDKSLCVVDLDTVMPGLSLYDFGDMVRSSSHKAREDEKDLSKVKIDGNIFRGLVRGYLSSAGEMLNEAEIENLLFSSKLLGLELGMRFFTDYLEGDNYFKTHREGQNLDRARVQFKFVKEVEDNRIELEKIIKNSLNDIRH